MFVIAQCHSLKTLIIAPLQSLARTSSHANDTPGIIRSLLLGSLLNYICLE